MVEVVEVVEASAAVRVDLLRATGVGLPEEEGLRSVVREGVAATSKS